MGGEEECEVELLVEEELEAVLLKVEKEEQFWEVKRPLERVVGEECEREHPIEEVEEELELVLPTEEKEEEEWEVEHPSQWEEEEEHEGERPLAEAKEVLEEKGDWEVVHSF